MKNCIKYVVIGILGLAILSRIFGGGSDKSEVAAVPPTATTRPTAKPSAITVKAGELREYENKITKTGVVNVYMLDGTLDEREDDLKQLCLDWHFYRAQILKFTAEGKTEKADSARNSLDQINYWLEDYDQDDVTFLLALIQERGW
jgi:hypothetical protein